MGTPFTVLMNTNQHDVHANISHDPVSILTEEKQGLPGTHAWPRGRRAYVYVH